MVPGSTPSPKVGATHQSTCPSAQWVANVGRVRAAATSRLEAALLPAPLADDAAASGAEVRELTPALSRVVTLGHRDAVLSPAAKAFVDLAVG